MSLNRNLFLSALFCLLLFVVSGCGCGSKQRNLDGYWVPNDPNLGYALKFGKDEVEAIVGPLRVAFDFKQNGDKLEINRADGDKVGMNVSVIVKLEWIDADHIQITSDSVTLFAPDENRRTTIMHRATREEAEKYVEGGAGRQVGPSEPPQPQTPQSQSTTCVSNLKQLGTAALLYATDYDQVLPDSLWQAQLNPYTKNIALFKCPALKFVWASGYSYNLAPAGRRLDSVKAPPSMAMFFESEISAPNTADIASFLTKSRHDGTISLVYLDGHATKMKEGLFP